MKRLSFVLGMAGFVLLTNPFSIQAQTMAKKSTNTAVSIEDKAERQAAKATKELGLNDEQRSKFKKFAADRLYKVQPINEKIQTTSDETEKANLKAQKKQINEEFFNNVNSILTPAQQEIWKKKREELQNHKHHAEN